MRSIRARLTMATSRSRVGGADRVRRDRSDRHLPALVLRPQIARANTPIFRSISNTDPLEASRAAPSLHPVGGVLPPYLIFKTLPKVCPDKLPGGYASFGLVFEPNHDMPIGVSRRWRLGMEQVGLNCAACHTGTVRETREQPAHDCAGHARASIWISNDSSNSFSPAVSMSA